uniref:Uncharacterized protein n=1 Tax=Kalanchoe fedtschenkoi TaxID=63787 RepID=A0A7N0TB10_KALFE
MCFHPIKIEKKKIGVQPRYSRPPHMQRNSTVYGPSPRVNLSRRQHRSPTDPTAERPRFQRQTSSQPSDQNRD